jgi:Dolichol-phosphate mannosyltransferase subunit 3 (DPM3)
VTFGSYSLWCLGWGLMTFRDCPDAHMELMGVSLSYSVPFTFECGMETFFSSSLFSRK